MKKKIVRILTSVRLAIILLTAIALICAADTLIPQNQADQAYVQRFGETGAKVVSALALDHVLTSPWMYGCGILFGVNLVCCTLKRGYWALAVWRQKRSLSAWGSPVLHVGLCFVLVGAAFNFMFSSRLYYEIPVGETASVQGVSGAFKMTVDDFGIEYYDDGVTPRQYMSRLTIRGSGDGPAVSRTVEVNAPVKYDGISILQQDYGWEAAITVSTDKVSQEIKIKDEEWIPLSSGGDQAISLGVAFYPNYGEGGVAAGKSDRDSDPRIMWVLSQGNSPLMSGELAPGETGVIQEPLKLSFDGYRYYTGLQAKYDPGIGIIFGGFFLVCLGLVMKFALPDKAKKGEENAHIDA